MRLICRFSDYSPHTWELGVEAGLHGPRALGPGPLLTEG